MLERVRVGCRSRWSGTLRLRSGCRHQSPRACPRRSRAMQVQLWSSTGHMRVLPHQHCPLCGHRRTWRHTRESCLLARLHQPSRFLLLRIFGNSKLTMVWWLPYLQYILLLQAMGGCCIACLLQGHDCDTSDQLAGSCAGAQASCRKSVLHRHQAAWIEQLQGQVLPLPLPRCALGKSLFQNAACCTEVFYEARNAPVLTLDATIDAKYILRRGGCYMVCFT